MTTPRDGGNSERVAGSADRVSLSKSDDSQPVVDVESLAVSVDGEAGAGQLSRSRRAVAAAANARDHTIRRLVGLLVPLIRATRFPLLAVVLLAAVPAIVLILVALLRLGPDDPFWLVGGAAGLVVAGWLAVRRHQLLAIAADPDALADALSSVVTGRDLWEQLAQNVSTRKVGATVLRKSRPLRILGGLWRGVQLTGILGQITERPELLPLLPGRLRGMWFLGIACVIASLVLWLSVLVAGLFFLLGG